MNTTQTITLEDFNLKKRNELNSIEQQLLLLREEIKNFESKKTVIQKYLDAFSDISACDSTEQGAERKTNADLSSKNVASSNNHSDSETRISPLRELIGSFLKDRYSGATTVEIRDYLKKAGEEGKKLPESFSKHNAYLYNILRHLEQSAVLEKISEGEYKGNYRLK